MRRALRQPRPHYFIKCAAVTALFFLLVSACAAQASPAGQPDMPWSKDLKKYPGLLPEVGRLVDKLQHSLQFPPARGPSRLLPLLPEATMSYAAFPNYGDVTYQALKIFRQELKESSVLRDWWQHGEVATAGPKVEDSLEKIYRLSQYLGEEIVLSGSIDGKESSLLILAEVRKPGLEEFLQQMVKELAGKSKPPVRVLDLQELATAGDRRPAQELLLLVRPGFVAGALDVATLRSFNTRLERNSREFVSTPFGQRVARAYEGGAAILAAADLQKILSQAPTGTKQDQMTLQRTGFADVKYLVWEHKSVPGQAASQLELSFTGPRHGVASWLAAPTPLGSLDFVSPKAILAASVVLSNPAQVFEDVRELAAASNPKAFAAITQSEQALKLSFKEDLLRQLGGEITVEIDNATPEPVWRAILQVNDPALLQRTLTTLLAAVQFRTEQFDDAGVTYHSVRIPSGKTVMEIGYAFVDGYLVIASSPETAADAVRLHRTGESLGKSRKFLASLPPGWPSGASALVYQDAVAMTALRMQQAPPEIAQLFAQAAGESMPVVMCAYADESAIRGASTNAAMDAGMGLVAAAIAIPNLLRSRIAANEASAVGMMRTVNTAQVTYAAIYPERGYAPDLATLGPAPAGGGAESADHAGLIDATLGNASCTAGSWCTKSGFRFSLTSVCKQQPCDEFVAVGTPVASNTGGRNFCSTSDGVIRFQPGPPLTSPVSLQECQAWSPLQ